MADNLNIQDQTSANTTQVQTAAQFIAVNAAATSGDLILLPPGTFALGDTTVTQPDGVTWRGAGQGLTIITGSRVLADGPILQPGNNGRIEDLTVQGVAAVGQYQAPIGSTTGSTWSTAYVSRVTIIGDSDGFYIQSGTRTLIAEDCTINTKFDGLNTAGGTAHQITLTNCTFNTIGPSGVSPAVNISRCLGVGVSSTVTMLGGTLKARDGGASRTECFSAAVGATCYFQDVTFDSSSAGPFFFGHVSTATTTVRGGRFVQTTTAGIVLDGDPDGTLNLFDVYLSTSGNNGVSPITIADTPVLRVRGSTLISQGTNKCIKNGDAGTYTVDCYGTVTNVAADTGITASGITTNAAVT